MPFVSLSYIPPSDPINLYIKRSFFYAFECGDCCLQSLHDASASACKAEFYDHDLNDIGVRIKQTIARYPVE